MIQISNQVYANKKPWHGGGLKVDSTSVVEAISHDRLLSSPLVKCPVMVGTPDGQFVDGPNHYAVVREADNRILGWCGRQYTIAQHLDLAAFADRVSSEFGARFEIAGLLRGGAQFVLQAAIADSRAVGYLRDGRTDVVTPYLTIGTSHDGDKPTEIGFATVRAECANMTAMAMQEARGGKRGVRYFALRHTGDLSAMLKDVERSMTAGLKAWGEFAEFAERAAQTRMERDAFDAFAAEVFPVAEGKNPSRAQTKRDQLYSLFDNGIGNSGATAWDAYNAVTEYTNYWSPVRGVTNAGDQNLARVNSVLYGDGADLAAQAENLLRAFVAL